MRRNIEEAVHLESRHALHHPEHRHGTDRVERNKLGPTRHVQRNAPNECYESQHNVDESNLSDLDSDIEEGYAGRDSCALAAAGKPIRALRMNS
jgi:hypothetical protein